MNQVIFGRAGLLCAALLLSSGAHAISTITANGRASPELAPPTGSILTDTAAGSPIPRTIVSVADEEAGLWRYAATADIATPKLQVFGSINNSGGGALGNFEVAVLSANATVRDTITITAPSADPYIVTAAMVIDGVLDVDGTNGRVNALLTIAPEDRLSATQSRAYTTNATIVDDVLPISFQFSGDAVFDLSSSLFFSVSRVDAGASLLADFSNTALIKLTVTTLAGDVIEGVDIASESGNFGVAPVPVPAALPLMITALAALGCRRVRRTGAGRIRSSP